MDIIVFFHSFPPTPNIFSTYFFCFPTLPPLPLAILLLFSISTFYAVLCTRFLYMSTTHMYLGQGERMSQEQPRPLTEEELREIVAKAVKEGREEAKYILEIEEWYRQGEAFIDEQTVEIVFGEAEQVELETFDEGYPYRKGRRLAIIPKTVPTIVLVERHDNTGNQEVHEKWLYVFTREGWKRIRVQ